MSACAFVLMLTASIGLTAGFGVAADDRHASTQPMDAAASAPAKPGDAAADVDAVARRSKERIQRIVDDLRGRLAVSPAIVVSVVPKDPLLVSVQRLANRENTFGLSFEAGFCDTLSDRELEAAVAHELGHVWIFGHHPYLQTEDLANSIALRVVSRESLEELYDKVWKRAGAEGHLVHFEPR